MSDAVLSIYGSRFNFGDHVNFVLWFHYRDSSTQVKINDVDKHQLSGTREIDDDQYEPNWDRKYTSMKGWHFRILADTMVFDAIMHLGDKCCDITKVAKYIFKHMLKQKDELINKSYASLCVYAHHRYSYLPTAVTYDSYLPLNPYAHPHDAENRLYDGVHKTHFHLCESNGPADAKYQVTFILGPPAVGKSYFFHLDNVEHVKETDIYTSIPNMGLGQHANEYVIVGNKPGGINKGDVLNYCDTWKDVVHTRVFYGEQTTVSWAELEKTLDISKHIFDESNRKWFAKTKAAYTRNKKWMVAHIQMKHESKSLLQNMIEHKNDDWESEEPDLYTNVYADGILWSDGTVDMYPIWLGMCGSGWCTAHYAHDVDHFSSYGDFITNRFYSDRKYLVNHIIPQTLFVGQDASFIRVLKDGRIHEHKIAERINTGDDYYPNEHWLLWEELEKHYTEAPIIVYLKENGGNVFTVERMGDSTCVRVVNCDEDALVTKMVVNCRGERTSIRPCAEYVYGELKHYRRGRMFISECKDKLIQEIVRVFSIPEPMVRVLEKKQLRKDFTCNNPFESLSTTDDPPFTNDNQADDPPFTNDGKYDDPPFTNDNQADDPPFTNDGKYDDPGHAGALQKLADHYKKIGDNTMAMEYYGMLVRTYPGHKEYMKGYHSCKQVEICMNNL